MSQGRGLKSLNLSLSTAIKIKLNNIMRDRMEREEVGRGERERKGERAMPAPEFLGSVNPPS
jgi:hypothetical protein